MYCYGQMPKTSVEVRKRVPFRIGSDRVERCNTLPLYKEKGEVLRIVCSMNPVEVVKTKNSRVLIIVVAIEQIRDNPQHGR